MMVPILEKIGKGLELQPNAQGITWRCWQFKDMNETHTEKGNTLDTHMFQSRIKNRHSCVEIDSPFFVAKAASKVKSSFFADWKGLHHVNLRIIPPNPPGNDALLRDCKEIMVMKKMILRLSRVVFFWFLCCFQGRWKSRSFGKFRWSTKRLEVEVVSLGGNCEWKQLLFG